MEALGKKRRYANFTELETNVLTTLTKKPKYEIVLKNKKNNTATNNLKQRTWKDIELEFNSTIGCQMRSAACLRQKFENINKENRRAIAKVKKENSETNYDSFIPAETISIVGEDRDPEEIITLSCEDLKPLVEINEDFSFDPKTQVRKRSENTNLISNRFEVLTSQKLELLELRRNMVIDTQKKSEEEHIQKMKILKLQEEKYTQKIKLLKLQESEILLRISTQT